MRPATPPRLPLTALVLGGLALLAAFAWWRLGAGGAPVLVERRPVGIMGTSCTLGGVVPAREEAQGTAALAAAEGELRRLEAALSTWIEASEISRLNAAAADVAVPLSRDSRALLDRARQLHRESAGAFDITCRPLVTLWRRAGEAGRLPTPPEITAARAASSWEQLELTAEGARKRSASAQVDLGGIAKGYAIDRALESLRAHGLTGGLVEVGGDLAVFGSAPDGEAWEIAVRDPRSETVWGTLRLRAGAVCTSGDYARYVEIEGRRHSHIVDPRSGQPADRAASVTVVAPDATTADAWATALAVLGPEGLPLLPAPGTVEALLVFRDDDGRLHASATPGIARLVTPEDPGFVRLLAGEALPAGR